LVDRGPDERSFGLETFVERNDVERISRRIS
jgi:hypothetical protein